MELFPIVISLLFAGLIVGAYVLRYKFSVGDRTHKDIAQYVRENTDADTLAAFICSNSSAGNVGLFFKKDSIICSNPDQTVFQISSSQLSLVEYSERNFFRFYIDGRPVKISYLHDPKEGESVANNLIFATTPNLSWVDKGATNTLIATLDKLNIPHNKVSHSSVLFLPYQGSPAAIAIIILSVLACFVVFIIM